MRAIPQAIRFVCAVALLAFVTGAMAQDGRQPLSEFAQATVRIETPSARSHIFQVYVARTDREHMQGYMRSRDRQFQGILPASTLMIVLGFTKPEFVVEIEVVAAAPERD